MLNGTTTPRPITIIAGWMTTETRLAHERLLDRYRDSTRTRNHFDPEAQAAREVAANAKRMRTIESNRKRAAWRDEQRQLKKAARTNPWIEQIPKKVVKRPVGFGEMPKPTVHENLTAIKKNYIMRDKRFREEVKTAVKATGERRG